MTTQIPSVNIIPYTDPLVYSSYPLSFSSDKMQDGLATLYSKTGLTNNDPDTYEEILRGTTIKRACCMGKKTMPVKIPIPLNYNGVPQDINKKFNYITKEITIPDGVCGEYIQNTQKCDNFFATYCENVKNDLSSLSGKFDSALWTQYSPECACYGQTYADLAKEKGTPLDSNTQRMLNNISPKTYMPSCNNPSVAYQDKQSREDNRSLTICSALVEIRDASAGQNMAVSNIMAANNCGGDSQPTTPTSPTQNEQTDTAKDTTAKDTTAKDTTAKDTAAKDTTEKDTTTKDTTTKDTTTKDTTTTDTTTIKNEQTNTQKETSAATSNTTMYVAMGGVSLSILCCCLIIILIILIFFFMS
jgi:hypothetical protein